MKYSGRGVSKGIATGLVWRPAADFSDELARYIKESPAREAAKVGEAVRVLAERLAAAAREKRSAGKKEEADILTAHAMMASDKSMTDAATRNIAAGKVAPLAVMDAAEENALKLLAIDDPYIRERASDIRDVGRAIARVILGVDDSIPEDERIIAMGDEVSPGLIASLPAGKLAGLALFGGGTGGHAAIIAKSRGVPIVAALGKEAIEIKGGTLAIINGTDGTLTTEPDEAELLAARETMEAERCQTEAGARAKGPALTTDGRRVFLLANVASSAEAKAAVEGGAEGIGLFRTEFLYMGRPGLPTEEELAASFREAALSAVGYPCVIRTMDAGGDKKIPALQRLAGEDTFLGKRGIRVSFDCPDMFRAELRALLTASADGDIRVMLPMVTSVAEVRAARRMLETEAEEVTCGKKSIPLGVMIETPAAVMISDKLAKYADFFSIGTNDLTQYILAAERTGSVMDSLGGYFHPAVLRAIERTADAAKSAGITCSVCGEMAEDPMAIPLLIAMGIDTLSVPASSLPDVRAAVRGISLTGAKLLKDAALAMDDADEVKAHMKDALAS